VNVPANVIVCVECACGSHSQAHSQVHSQSHSPDGEGGKCRMSQVKELVGEG